jgi:hypothetical protein
MRRVEPLDALRGGERARDTLGPPLAVGPRVPVAKSGYFAPLAGDEEDEVVAGSV